MAAASTTVSDASSTLTLKEEPKLLFRQLHHELNAFASHRMDDVSSQELMATLVEYQTEFLKPLTLQPKDASERQALQSNHVNVLGKTIDVASLIQQEIMKLSDEFQLSEKRCVELWFLASDAQRREWIERTDQLPAESITASIPAAARHFLISEMEFKLNLLKELLRLRLDERMENKQRHFLLTYTNELLTQGLVQKLVQTFENELPALLQIPQLQQSASYWHALVAECLLFIISSTRLLPSEAMHVINALQSLCKRLNAILPKVSPHLINLASIEQLYSTGLSASPSSPESVVKQVECIVQALVTMQMAFSSLLLEQSEKLDRESNQLVNGCVLSGKTAEIKELHRLIVDHDWQQQSFQSMAKLVWAGFLGAVASDASVFEADQTIKVVKKAIEECAFSSLVDIVLKYLPDRKFDPVLFDLMDHSLELVFGHYVMHTMIDVPTLADQAAMEEMQSEVRGEGDHVASWSGDCLETVIELAAALCSNNPTFTKTFWPMEDNSNDADGSLMRCDAFLIACRDAAYKNPACFSAYMRLVAAAASGPDCAQHAFHHLKQNPSILNWDHFFNVMNKYYRLLSDAEKPPVAGFSSMKDSTRGAAAAVAKAAANRHIRPKELEALEMIQSVIQAVVRDDQLALIFFHNHEWSPIQTFVSLLQCKIPSSLKGALMKTLAIFVRVPDIAPFVWRQIDAVQILRTTSDTSLYGNQDLSFELEHNESIARRYPATRGFLSLLLELFENPHVWSSMDSESERQALQCYFDFLLERIFMKLELRQYDNDEEKWALVSGTLAIFKKILRSSVAFGLHEQLLFRFISTSSLLQKLLSIVTADGGMEGLENASNDVRCEHAFTFCRSFVKKQTEKTHGSLHIDVDDDDDQRKPCFTNDSLLLSRPGYLRERAVQLALEILLLVLEQDVAFVESGKATQLNPHAQVELVYQSLSRHHRTELVRIIQYVGYLKSVDIAKLSTAIFRMVSNGMAGSNLVDLIADAGASADVMLSYMNRLLTEDEEVTRPSMEYEDEPESEVMGSPSSVLSKKRKRRDSLSLPFEEQMASRTSIRAIILDLILENLVKPYPNAAHLLLGLLDQNFASSDPTFVRTGLDAIILLLLNADFGFEAPELAERCHKVIYLLLTSDATSRLVLTRLEHAQSDFFAHQLELFGSVYCISRRTSASAITSELNMRGWFFKSLAVYIHTLMVQEPPQYKKVNRLIALLLSAVDEDKERSRIMLLHQLDQISFEVMPPTAPSNQEALVFAQQVTAQVDQGYFKWLKIDVERFCEELQALDLSTAPVDNSLKRFRTTTASPPPASPQSELDRLVRWAIQWNVFSERIAAESHALNALRELIEVMVLDYFGSDFDSDHVSQHEDPVAAMIPAWQGLTALASREVRWEIVSSIASVVMRKLVDKSSMSAQLFEILCRTALLLFSHLRRAPSTSGTIESHQKQQLVFLELVFRAICNASASTGNPTASRNARTLLYSSIVNILSCIPQPDDDYSAMRYPSTTPSSAQRLNVLTVRAMEVVWKDACDGDDVLSMALAVGALEAMISFDRVTAVRVLRERGLVVHFIGLFRKLCEMDSANQADWVGKAAKTMDPAMVGTMYECFLSFFTKLSLSPDGAVSLLESGLLRVLQESQNLPTHRPKAFAQLTSTTEAAVASDALRQVEALYYRKWLPVLRLLAAVCATLPQNRTVVTQLLQWMVKMRKAVTAAIKIPPSRMSLSSLRETSYVTFLLRYVAQFPDLCGSALSVAKWDKMAQHMVRLVLFYGRDLLPPATPEQSQASSKNWWDRIVPTLATEERDCHIQRFAASIVSNVVASTGSSAVVECLGALSLFEEEALYVSRMILCNASAFCATRMMHSCDQENASSRSSLLLSTSQRPSTSSFAAMRSGQMAMDSLWNEAPSIDEFMNRLEAAIKMLATASKSQQQQEEAAQPLRRVIEFQYDSLMFVVENMLLVLILHFHQLSSAKNPKTTVMTQQAARKVLTLVERMPTSPFAHSMARQLRDLV